MNAPRHHSRATRQKMSESKPKRPVIAIDIETRETRVFESTRAATDQGFASSNITAAAKGRLRHCYGYYWRYLDEFESVDKVFAEVKERPSGVLRPVVSIDPKTKKSKAYPSIVATGGDGFTYDSVMAALCGRSRRAGERFWRYAEDFTGVEGVLAEEAVYDASKRST